jgi:hypothetical protein
MLRLLNLTLALDGPTVKKISPSSHSFDLDTSFTELDDKEDYFTNIERVALLSKAHSQAHTSRRHRGS